MPIGFQNIKTATKSILDSPIPTWWRGGGKYPFLAIGAVLDIHSSEDKTSAFLANTFGIATHIMLQGRRGILPFIAPFGAYATARIVGYSLSNNEYISQQSTTIKGRIIDSYWNWRQKYIQKPQQMSQEEKEKSFGQTIYNVARFAASKTLLVAGLSAKTRSFNEVLGGWFGRSAPFVRHSATALWLGQEVVNIYNAEDKTQAIMEFGINVGIWETSKRVTEFALHPLAKKLKHKGLPGVGGHLAAVLTTTAYSYYKNKQKEKQAAIPNEMISVVHITRNEEMAQEIEKRGLDPKEGSLIYAVIGLRGRKTYALTKEEFDEQIGKKYNKSSFPKYGVPGKGIAYEFQVNRQDVKQKGSEILISKIIEPAQLQRRGEVSISNGFLSLNKAVNPIKAHDAGRWGREWTTTAIDSDFAPGSSIVLEKVVNKAKNLFSGFIKNKVSTKISATAKLFRSQIEEFQQIGGRFELAEESELLRSKGWLGKWKERRHGWKFSSSIFRDQGSVIELGSVSLKELNRFMQTGNIKDISPLSMSILSHEMGEIRGLIRRRLGGSKRATELFYHTTPVGRSRLLNQTVSLPISKEKEIGAHVSQAPLWDEFNILRSLSKEIHKDVYPRTLAEVRNWEITKAGYGENVIGKFQEIRKRQMVLRRNIDNTRISGFDDAYNSIEGLKHNGIAPWLRKTMTHFGSGAIFRMLSATMHKNAALALMKNAIANPNPEIGLKILSRSIKWFKQSGGEFAWSGLDKTGQELGASTDFFKLSINLKKETLTKISAGRLKDLTWAEQKTVMHELFETQVGIHKLSRIFGSESKVLKFIKKSPTERALIRGVFSEQQAKLYQEIMESKFGSHFGREVIGSDVAFHKMTGGLENYFKYREAKEGIRATLEGGATYFEDAAYFMDINKLRAKHKISLRDENVARELRIINHKHKQKMRQMHHASGSGAVGATERANQTRTNHQK